MKNFNKDWNSGIAIASLVESTAPGLFPEWEDLLPENKLENAREAMKRAEEWLGVPQVRGKTTMSCNTGSLSIYIKFHNIALVK